MQQCRRSYKKCCSIGGGLAPRLVAGILCSALELKLEHMLVWYLPLQLLQRTDDLQFWLIWCHFKQIEQHPIVRKMHFLSSGFIAVWREWDWLQYAQIIWLEVPVTSDRGVLVLVVPCFFLCWIDSPIDHSLATTSLLITSIMAPNSHSPSFSSLLTIRHSSAGNLQIRILIVCANEVCYMCSIRYGIGRYFTWTSRIVDLLAPQYRSLAQRTM